jgi:hypothetical protein
MTHHSHLGSPVKATVQVQQINSSLTRYWQARPIPTPAKLEIILRPSFCFGRRPLSKALPLTHLTLNHHPHPSGRLPTVYPSASTSNKEDRRRTWTRNDSRAPSRRIFRPSASDPIQFRLPHRDLTLSRPPSNAFTCASPLHRLSPDQTLLRIP